MSKKDIIPISFETLDITIKLLKSVILDQNCNRMNHSNIKGYLGELLVIKKLSNYTTNIIHKGNQSGYDIEITDKDIKIDVKYSTIKTEVSGCPPYWGWALKHKNKQKPVSCTHFVCVAANKNYDPENYYMIKSDDLNLFPESAIKQFKNVERGLCILHYNSSYSQIIDAHLREYFQKCSRLLKQNLIVKVSSQGNLMQSLLKK